MAEGAALGKQLAALAEELKTLNAELASWEESQSRLDDLEDWCRIVAQNIDLLDYAGRRLALDAEGVEVRVWSTDHTPRYEIKMIPDAAPVLVNGPHSDSDDALAVAHVDGYTRRGCVNNDSGLVLRWTDQDCDSTGHDLRA